MKILVFIFLALFLLLTGCSGSKQLVNDICNTTGDICGTVTYLCDTSIPIPADACVLAEEICKYAKNICYAIDDRQDLEAIYSDLIEVKNVLVYYESEIKTDRGAAIQIAFNKALEEMKEIYYVKLEGKDE